VRKAEKVVVVEAIEIDKKIDKKIDKEIDKEIETD
jgi:hypothetical protein